MTTAISWYGLVASFTEQLSLARIRRATSNRNVTYTNNKTSSSAIAPECQKYAAVNRFARLNKHLKTPFGRGDWFTPLYAAIESVMHGTINGVEAAGVLTISAILGLLSVFGYQKLKPPLNPVAFSPLRRLRRADSGNAVGLPKHFPVNAPSYLSLRSALFIVILALPLVLSFTVTTVIRIGSRS